MNKLKRARLRVLQKDKLLGHVLLHLKFREDTATKTMATDGKYIYYNQKFVDNISNAEIEGVIAHEVLHVMLKHHTLRGQRDRVIWNHATDYIINYELLQRKFYLPTGALINPSLGRLNSYKVYNIIKDNFSRDNKGNAISKEEHPGEVLDSPKKTNTKSEEKRINRIVEQAIITKCISNGNYSAGVHRKIRHTFLTKSDLDWKAILDNYLNKYLARDDYNFGKRNRRYMQSNIVMPTICNESLNKIIVAIDSSGSMGIKDLEQVEAELNNVRQNYNCEFTVLYFDIKVFTDKIQTISAKEPVKLIVYGGGNTSYANIFEEIKYNNNIMDNPNVLLIFTDGFCHTFGRIVPDYPVLWTVTRRVFSPPFGHVIYNHKG